MADARRKDAIWTYTGRIIRPLDPNPDDICIDDIAHSLANQCRFTGHTRKFYSVAQHSFLVADCLEERGHPDLMMQGLLHDASEAYLSDLARPIKRSPTVMAFYDEAEIRLMDAVWEAFGIDIPDWSEDKVREADDALLRAEARDLMPDTFPLSGTLQGEHTYEWKHPILPVTPDVAEQLFMETYYEIKDRLDEQIESPTA